MCFRCRVLYNTAYAEVESYDEDDMEDEEDEDEGQKSEVGNWTALESELHDDQAIEVFGAIDAAKDEDACLPEVVCDSYFHATTTGWSPSSDFDNV